MLKNMIIKDALKGVVKGNGGSSRGIEDAVHDGEAQAAHQGRGNTVAVQEADLAGDHASQPEQECAQRNSVVHIQTDLKHSCTVLSLCYFALQSFSGHRPPTQSNGFCKSKNTHFDEKVKVYCIKKTDKDARKLLITQKNTKNSKRYRRNGLPVCGQSGNAKKRRGRDSSAPLKKKGMKGAQPWFCASTRRTPQYFSRSLGFSILPVGLRGMSAKMIFRGACTGADPYRTA